MDHREDLTSILPYLPLKLQQSSSSSSSPSSSPSSSGVLAWPNPVSESLKSLSKGPSHSRVDSGDTLFLTISDLRNSLSLSSHPFSRSASHGYALFFDEFLTRDEAAKWFGDVIPEMANMLLKLPTLLGSHYQYSDLIMVGVETGLRLLEPQKPGIVFLSQELVAALLSCSMFCLFPTAHRGAKHLPMINFDKLFAVLSERYRESQVNKIKCLIRYFERITSCMPAGSISFERKVLPLEHSPPLVSYPSANLWANSGVALCQFEVCSSGLIEDQLKGALEVDFANKKLGGGALSRGCVQEEIRFMINPELIAGMLFLPSMSDNEAIEIVGAERFSNYSGYAFTFQYSGDHIDRREVDSLGRRKTRIVAIDALSRPGSRQFILDCLVREVNKAFCGFLDSSKYSQYQMLLRCTELHEAKLGNDIMDITNCCETKSAMTEDIRTSSEMNDDRAQLNKTILGWDDNVQVHDFGVATGNWGCGAFGGDPEVKTVIQWMAASQALRPFISYCTFGLEALQNLDEVSKWILSQKLTVGDLWKMLVDYCSKRSKGETKLGFLSWLAPSFDRQV